MNRNEAKLPWISVPGATVRVTLRSAEEPAAFRDDEPAAVTFDATALAPRAAPRWLAYLVDGEAYDYETGLPLTDDQKAALGIEPMTAEDLETLGED